MGVVVRAVPPGWQHPVNDRGDFVGQYDGDQYEPDMLEWEADGSIPEEQPNPKSYMPRWSPEEATHFMLYETVTEGTPISAAFASMEALMGWVGGRRFSEVVEAFYKDRRTSRNGDLQSPNDADV